MSNKRVIVYGTASEQALVRTIEELRRENAALRAERVLVSVHTGKFTTISGRAMICPDCGRALLHEDRAVIDAARKEAQPWGNDPIMRRHLSEGGTPA